MNNQADCDCNCCDAALGGRFGFAQSFSGWRVIRMHSDLQGQRLASGVSTASSAHEKPAPAECEENVGRMLKIRRIAPHPMLNQDGGLVLMHDEWESGWQLPLKSRRGVC